MPTTKPRPKPSPVNLRRGFIKRERLSAAEAVFVPSTWPATGLSLTGTLQPFEAPPLPPPEPIVGRPWLLPENILEACAVNLEDNQQARLAKLLRMVKRQLMEGLDLTLEIQPEVRR